jgi:hypothetical protein
MYTRSDSSRSSWSAARSSSALRHVLTLSIPAVSRPWR